MKSLRRCVVSAGAVALAMAGGAREAKAAGFANTNAGGEQGTVVSTNPMSLYYNPGAMGLAKGSQLGLYGSLIHPACDVLSGPPARRRTSRIPRTRRARTRAPAHLINLFGGPRSRGTLKFGNLTLGAGFFAPFGGSAHWGQNAAFERREVPAGRRRACSAGSASTASFASSTSPRARPTALGHSASALRVISSARPSTRRKPRIRGGHGLPRRRTRGRAFLDAHTFNGSFAVGRDARAVAGPTLDWRLVPSPARARTAIAQRAIQCLVARARRIQDSPVDFQADAARYLSGRHPMEAQERSSRISGLRRLDQLECVQVPVSRTRGEPVHDRRRRGGQHGGRRRAAIISVATGTTRTAGASGVSWLGRPAVELLFGGGYETARGRPTTTLAPDLPDANNFQATLGARFRLTESLFLTASYTHIQYMTRDTTGKSTLEQDAQGNTVAFPTVRGRLPAASTSPGLASSRATSKRCSEGAVLAARPVNGTPGAHALHPPAHGICVHRTLARVLARFSSPTPGIRGRKRRRAQRPTASGAPTRAAPALSVTSGSGERREHVGAASQPAVSSFE